MNKLLKLLGLTKHPHKSDLTPKGFKTTYPTDNYQKLSEMERFKLLEQQYTKEHLILQK